MWPIDFIAAASAVVVLDQATKILAGRFLRDRSISLGRLGEMKLARRRVWIAQGCDGRGLPVLWGCWLFGAVVVLLVSGFVPGNAWYGALLVGGAASHLLETSRHGAVRDYVWLRFWPGFNLADVVICAGTFGLALTLAKALTSPLM